MNQDLGISRRWLAVLIVCPILVIGGAAWVIVKKSAPPADAEVVAANIPVTKPATPPATKPTPTFLPASVPTPATSPVVFAARKSLPPTVITGNAWINRAGGSSDVLRGFHVSLLRKTVVKSVVKEPINHVANYWKELGEKKQEDADMDRYRLKGEINPLLKEFDEEHLKVDQASADEHFFRQKSVMQLFDSLANTLDVKEAHDAIFRHCETRPHIFSPVVGASRDMEAISDVNGAYVLTVLQSGDYYLHGELSTPTSFIDWLIPVTCVGGNQKIDIFNDNALTINN